MNAFPDRRAAVRRVLPAFSGLSLFAVRGAFADQTNQLTASDKLSIMELAARFEMALDREDVESYLATFQDSATLEGLVLKRTERRRCARRFGLC